MSGPITAQMLERFLADRAPDVDSAFRKVSPVGLNIGTAELQLFLGVDATADPAKFAARAVDYLTQHRLIGEFSAILLRSDATAFEAKIANMKMPLEIAQRLVNETVAARCGIFRGDEFRGSGCLVGPSLVLTCAHVLGTPQADGSFRGLDVLLSTHVRLPIHGQPLHFSAPADADHVLPLSADDADYAERDDYALIRLIRPDGANAAIAPLETDDWEPTANATFKLFNYPRDGEDGIGEAVLGRFIDPSARWAYVGPAEPGWSGSGCFNVRGALFGLHQGKLSNGSRLVPSRRFRTAIAPLIADDLAPPHLWSVDGRLDGTLVIGRDDLFAAFARLAERESPYRALRIRRLDPGLGNDGLGYSINLVQQLVKRRPDGHEAIVLGWPQVVQQDFDIIDQLAQVASIRGLAGSAPSLTGPPGERAKTLLGTLDAAAATAGRTLWILIEHSATPLGSQTAALEALASAIPLWTNLRLVLVGNEAIGLPYPEYRPSDIGADPLPGATLVDYIRPFTRAAIGQFIDLIHQDLVGAPPQAQQRQLWTDNVLNGLAEISGSYALSDLPVVTQRLRAFFSMMLPMAQAA